MEMPSPATPNPAPPGLTYVLITAARNEEDLIENTIRSVISQTVLPDRWMIVSDGSTDKTDEIVARYARSHPWIESIRMPEHRDRSFAAKADCFNAGYGKIRQRPYAIIGNLDADITFGPDYFEFLLARFGENPRLGVAGTPFVEGTAHYDFRYASTEHVSGACQMFRRECFEEIGGYVPIKGGGIDWLAVTTARMKGWTTRTFVEKTCHHHRKIGTGDSGPWAAIFKYGRKNYMLGNHPLWQISRSVFQMRRKPYILGGVLLMSGYVWGYLTRLQRPLSRELLTFYRGEQMRRLKGIASRALGSEKER
jgi:glycosyltransferase involved in cell wall biosynthesis